MSDEDVRGIDQVFIVACGSAYHSGLVGKYAIERWARIPVQVEMASEFRYRDPVLGRNTLVIAVSQSGETADTLEAVRHARARGVGAGGDQHGRAPPSRARATPPSTPAADRRSPSPRPRR
jgi:glucosamine 6-phosphate synthetase-like amidotransferase/phosphosugar isomerase protein